MRRVLSTRLFAHERLTTSTLSRIERAGLRSVALYGERWSLDYRQRGRLEDLRSWFRDSELRPRAVIAPTTSDESGRGDPNAMLRITELDRPRRIKITDELKRVLEMADSIPYQVLLLTLGEPDEAYSEAAMDAAFNALDELNVMAGQLGVELLLYNFGNELATADRLAEFLRFTHLPLGYAFDFPSAQSTGQPAAEFESMSEKTRAVLAADGDDPRQPRLWPGREDSAIDWGLGRELLQELGDDTLLIADVDPDAEAADPLDRAQRAFDFLEGQD